MTKDIFRVWCPELKKSDVWPAQSVSYPVSSTCLCNCPSKCVCAWIAPQSRSPAPRLRDDSRQQRGTRNRARFQTGLVTVQHTAVHWTGGTASLQKRQRPPAVTQSIFPSASRQRPLCASAGTCELTDRRTQANFRDNGGWRHAEMYAPAKRQNAVSCLEKKTWQPSRAERRRMTQNPSSALQL